MMAPCAEPVFQLVFVPEPITMLPDPRWIFLDVASCPVSFQAPPIYVLNTSDRRLGETPNIAGATVAVHVPSILRS